MLILECKRNCYAAEDVRDTMSVGDLRDFLMDFNPDDLVVLSHDNGYTFGGIRKDDFREEDIKADIRE